MAYTAGSSSGGPVYLKVYLMSPVLTFNNGDTIKFYTRIAGVTSFADRLILKLSTSGSSVATANFNTTLLTVNPTLSTTGYPTSWTQFTGTVSGLAGPTTGRFAFDYDVPNGGPAGTNSFRIGIDTVTFTATPEPALGLVVIGVIGAIMRWRR
jgi:hypothetical protein